MTPAQRKIVQEALVTMQHARIFIGSRQIMHSIGIDLYEQSMDKLRRLLEDDAGDDAGET